MSTNENDPRPGMAEGRKSSAEDRTTTSVVALHFDDQCAPCTTQNTPDAQDLADDPIARILAEHSDVVITISEHPDDQRGTVERP